MLLNIGHALFAIAPMQELNDAAPEFYNNPLSVHNCVGGNEAGCVPGSTEASGLYRDPSKMSLPTSLPRPESWYHAPVSFM